MKLEPLAEIWYAFLMHFLSNIVGKSVLDEQSFILNLENANAKGT